MEHKISRKAQTSLPSRTAVRAVKGAKIARRGNEPLEAVTSTYEYTEGSRNNAYIVTSHASNFKTAKIESRRSGSK
jgi:hypothetical protein